MLTSSAAATPASLSASLADEQAKTTPDTSGPISPAPFAYYDPDGRCLKTCQATLDLGLTESSVILPPSGWMRNGNCYQRQPLVPRTSATGSSLWPTPVANDDKTPEAHLAMKQRMPGGPRRTITSLQVMVKAVESGMWPTPTVNESRNGANRTANRLNPDSKHHDGVTLVDAVRMWPTPQARDGHGRSAPSQTLAQDRWDQGKRCLEDAVSLNGQPGGMLNPTFCEWLMGFPMGWTEIEDRGTANGPESTE